MIYAQMNKFFEACRTVTDQYRADNGLEPLAEPKETAAPRVDTHDDLTGNEAGTRDSRVPAPAAAPHDTPGVFDAGSITWTEVPCEQCGKIIMLTSRAPSQPAVAAPKLDPDSELYKSLQKPEPIWTHSDIDVFKHGKLFCWCQDEQTAWFVADRLNAFDRNLTERNTFQRLYLNAIKPPSEEERK